MRSNISAPAREVLCRRRLSDSGLSLLLLAAHDGSLASLGSPGSAGHTAEPLGLGGSCRSSVSPTTLRGTWFCEDLAHRSKPRRRAGSCKHAAKAAGDPALPPEGTAKGTPRAGAPAACPCREGTGRASWDVPAHPLALHSLPEKQRRMAEE